MNGSGTLYILQSQFSGRYYIGVSTDPSFRLAQHNAGRVASTRKKGPWVIMFTKVYPSLFEAKKAEYKLKTLKRRDFMEEIIKKGEIPF